MALIIFVSIEGSNEPAHTRSLAKAFAPCIHKIWGLNKKISVFRVTGLNILGRVGTHIFLVFVFLEKHYFMHFERHFASQNA